MGQVLAAAAARMRARRGPAAAVAAGFATPLTRPLLSVAPNVDPCGVAQVSLSLSHYPADTVDILNVLELLDTSYWTLADDIVLVLACAPPTEVLLHELLAACTHLRATVGAVSKLLLMDCARSGAHRLSDNYVHYAASLVTLLSDAQATVERAGPRPFHPAGNNMVDDPGCCTADLQQALDSIRRSEVDLLMTVSDSADMLARIQSSMRGSVKHLSQAILSFTGERVRRRREVLVAVTAAAAAAAAVRG